MRLAVGGFHEPRDQIGGKERRVGSDAHQRLGALLGGPVETGQDPGERPREARNAKNCKRPLQR